MNRRQQYYIFWLTGITGSVLTALGILLYVQQFGLKKYMDAKAGFSIRFPQNWAYASNKDGALAIFYSPAESDYDQFVENVNVAIHDISINPMDIRQYSVTAIKQMETLFGQELDILESTEITVGGRRGHKFVFVGKGQEPIKMMMVWTMKGNLVYQITYTATAETFNFYLASVQRMINSFRLL